MSISKQVDEARAAFTSPDATAPARVHRPERLARAADEEHAGTGSHYIGEFIYGELDDITTTFAVVSGVVGANLNPGIILVLGLANLLADGVSMRTGAYLSAKSEREYYDREQKRELWEIENSPDGERQEMVQIYRRKGHTDDDARQLTELVSRRKQHWVEAMMVEELRLKRDDRNPLRNGLATLAQITARPNQDSPLIEGRTPLFGNDVWEHAYYLKYQNKQADYLQAWWNVVDWNAVTARYEAVRAGRTSA